MYNIFRFTLFYRITYDPFCFIKIDHNVRQIRFHVCIKMRRCKRRVCKRKTLFGQPNILAQPNLNSLMPGIFNIRPIFQG